MSKSILLVDTYYPAVIDSLGFSNPSHLTLDYEIHLSELTEAGFGTGAAYREGLTKIGWNAHMVVPNARGVQTLWANERSHARPVQLGWEYTLHLARLPLVRSYLHYVPHVHRTLLNQVRELQPDVLFIQDLNLIPRRFAKELKRHTRLLVGEIASPLPPKGYFLEYDLIVSALPTIVDQARDWGVRAEYIPLGFDSRRAVFSRASTRPIDAIFVGSFSRHQPQTIPLLQAVAEQIPGFQIYGPAPAEEIEQAGLSDFYKGQAWGQDMFDLLGKSKIVVNRHGTIAGDFAVNMRMFEATGCGAALVTEAKSNLRNLFDPEIEVAAYETPTAAAAIVDGLLRDTELLDALAQNGQKRTLGSHTYFQRAQTLSELLESCLHPI